MGMILFLQTSATRDGGLGLDRVKEARARLESSERSKVRGRAWINGREVGGPDLRFAHLARSFD